MKRGLLLGVILVLFLISVVSAATCSDPDQVIMKLYQQNNSHGSLWDGPAAYNEEICYTGNVPTNPHDCDDPTTPTNALIWLSDVNNSHASINKITGSYETPVCYGNLVCEYDFPDKASCNAWGGEIIMSLYQENNSHISIDNFAGYNTKVCCKPGIGFIWADMMGNSITDSNLGDSVKMIFNGAGSALDFDVKTNDLVGTSDVKLGLSSNFNGASAIAKWEIIEDEYEDGGNKDKFYFDVTGKGSEKEPYLAIEETVSNSWPNTIITAPALDTTTTVNTLIDFTQDSSDEDDDLRLTWDFGAGVTQIFENVLTTELGDTNYSYDSKGTKIIKLTAKEMTRGQQVFDATRVLVYGAGGTEGPKGGELNVFSIITTPGPGETVSGRVIYADGSDSFVAECFISKVACDAVDTTCYEVPGDLPIGCYDLDKSIMAGVWELLYYWTFDDGEIISGKHSDGATITTPTKFFLDPGIHQVNLQVGYFKSS